MVMAGVVVQLNEAAPDKHRAVLRNVANLIKEMPHLSVELVLFGKGIDVALVAVTECRDELEAAKAQGVVVKVCQNTLRQRNLKAADLLPGVEIVPAGVAELVRRQQDGYSYLRP